MRVRMLDVHEWLREWRGVVVEPGDLGQVADRVDGVVLVLWDTHADGTLYELRQAAWCEREVLEVVNDR